MAQVSRSLCCCVFVKRFPDVCAAAGAALGQKRLREHSVGGRVPPGRVAERSCVERSEAALQHRLFYSQPQELGQLSLGTGGLFS